MFPQAKLRRTSRIERETKLTISLGASHLKVLSYTSQLNCEKSYLLDASWHTNFPRFWDAQPDHLQVESLTRFPKELVS